MQWIWVVISAFILSCSGSSSSKEQAWMQEKEKIRVLCTTEMIAALVNEVGRPFIHNLVLIKGDLDPHSYEPVKGDQEKLTYASMIFYNGLGLEHGPSLKEFLKANTKAINLGDYLLEYFPSDLLTFQGQHDPHIWMDIQLFSKLLKPIAEHLALLDPSHRQHYHTQAKEAEKKCLLKHQQLIDTLSHLPEERRFLVTSHDAFHYFTRAYLASDKEKKTNTWSRRVMAPEGFAPEGKLSLQDIKETVDYIIRNNVYRVFTEANVNQDALKKVLSACLEKGVKVSMAKRSLLSDSMGKEGNSIEDYFSMLEHNAQLFFEEMQAEEGI